MAKEEPGQLEARTTRSFPVDVFLQGFGGSKTWQAGVQSRHGDIYSQFRKRWAETFVYSDIDKKIWLFRNFSEIEKKCGGDLFVASPPPFRKIHINH